MNNFSKVKQNEKQFNLCQNGNGIMVYAQFAEAGKRLSRAVYVLEKSVINTI
jgi:hypothetical protein